MISASVNLNLSIDKARRQRALGRIYNGPYTYDTSVLVSHDIYLPIHAISAPHPRSTKCYAHANPGKGKHAREKKTRNTRMNAAPEDLAMCLSSGESNAMEEGEGRRRGSMSGHVPG